MTELTLKEPITVPGRTANTLAAEIVAITNQTKQMVVMSAVEVGRRLEEAKALVGHGEWGDYVERECQMSHRSANNCMKIFREYRDNPNSQALANFSFTNALRLLSMPEEDREKVMEMEDAPDLSSRQLDKLAKELAEERAARQKAEDEAKAAKAAPKHWQTELDREKRKSKKLEEDLKAAQAKPELPEEELKKLREAELEKVRKEVEAQLKEARDQADAMIRKAQADQAAAAEALKESQAAATAAQTQAASAKKAQLLNDPDVVNFTAACSRIQESINVANGYLKKISLRDPEKAAKLRGGLLKLLSKQEEAVKEKGDNE